MPIEAHKNGIDHIFVGDSFDGGECACGLTSSDVRRAQLRPWWTKDFTLIPNRVWGFYMGHPFSVGRKSIFPWFGDDEKHRKTLVIPVLFTWAIVFALYEFRDHDPTCDFCRDKKKDS